VPSSEAFKELREWFVGQALARLDRMSLQLERASEDGQALRELRRELHGLAGAGGLYGFPLVTTLARRMEDECLAQIQAETLPGPAQLGRWRAVLVNVRREICGPPGPSAAETSAPREALVVAHDPGLLVVLIEQLEGQGLGVRPARTRAEAVRAIEERLPEALVVELLLPDGSGYELIEHLRGFDAAAATPILALSSETETAARMEAQRCGADVCLGLPLDPRAFRCRLEELLRRGADGPGRVLLVSDGSSQAERCAAVLSEAGHSVTTRARLSEVEAELILDPKDLVLVDGLRGARGAAELCRFLRQDPRHAALPFVVVGGGSGLGFRLELARGGIDEQLGNPVDPELLRAAVASRVRRARQARAGFTRDPLTRVITGTAFLEEAQEAWSIKRRSPERSWAWLAIDIDGFRTLNERHGPLLGDRVLVSLATLLRSRLRDEDRVARPGGDEFWVLLQGLDREEAVRLASRLLQEFLSVDRRELGLPPDAISFSGGVAWLEDGMSVSAWQEAALQALSRARGEGGARVREDG
jgi:diguanylate cyclase (GGDEF)-like protein